MSRSDAVSAPFNPSWVYDDADFADVEAYMTTNPWTVGPGYTAEVVVGDDDTGAVITFTPTTGSPLVVTVAVGQRLLHQVYVAGLIQSSSTRATINDPATVVAFDTDDVGWSSLLARCFYFPSES
jgi:hypothetical protein